MWHLLLRWVWVLSYWALVSTHSGSTIKANSPTERRNNNVTITEISMDDTNSPVCQLVQEVRNKSPGQDINEVFCLYHKENQETKITIEEGSCEKEIYC